MKCENCGHEHDGSYSSGRFCSQKCARGFSTKKKRKQINQKVSKALGGTGEIKKLKPCQQCGTPTLRNKFCSQKCVHLFKKELTKKSIEQNKHSSKRTCGVRSIKGFLIEQRGHECEICGTTEWMKKPVPLVLDHIDGNHENWILTNLRLICPNCDHQTPTFGSKNWGNGNLARRKYEREKYQKLNGVVH